MSHDTRLLFELQYRLRSSSMGSKHTASSSTSSAVVTAGATSHVKRRSGSGRASSSAAHSLRNASGGGGSTLSGLALDEERSSRTSSPFPPASSGLSPSNSFSRSSTSSSAGDEEWSSVSTQHDSGRGDSTEHETRSFASLERSTPIKARKSFHSPRKDGPWQPFTAQRWSPEKPKLPALFTEDTPLQNDVYEDDVHAASPFRLHPASPGMYRSATSSSSFYRSESLPMIASTSQSPYSLYAPPALSPSISFDNLSPSRASIDSRRNSETTLSIAPSPPMPSSSFQPHHLSSPSSLTNRTSPKSGSYQREDANSSTSLSHHASTSSFFPSTRRRPSADLARDLSDAPRIPNVHNSNQNRMRQSKWEAFSWRRRKRSPSDEGDSVFEATWPRSIARANHFTQSLAAACLGPFHQLIFAEHIRSASNAPSKSSSVPARTISPKPSYKRWQSTALRLSFGLYIFYSLLLFTSHLLSLPFPLLSSTDLPRHHQHSQLRARSDVLEYSKWQQARFKLLDAYNVAADAIGTTALRLGKQSSEAVAGDFAGESNGANSLNNLMLLDRLPEVKRRWGDLSKPKPSTSFSHSFLLTNFPLIANTRNPASNPLASFSTEYRFSKMFSKLDPLVKEQIEPFLFQAEAWDEAGDVTACLYFNDAWISELPAFMERWQGPVSLVYESEGNKTSPERNVLVAQLQDLRKQYPLIRKYVDIHAVYNSPQSELQARRMRERFILRPVASNFQLNLARFFAKTDMVWLVADARILPATGLRQRLNELREVRTYTMDYADAVIVPIFGATRAKIANSTVLPLLTGVREGIGLAARQDGVAKVDFQRLSQAYVSAYYDSIPLHPSDWPTDKASLLDLASDHPSASTLPEYLQQLDSPVFTLFDRRWEAGQGPTSFTKWKQAQYSPAEAKHAASKAQANTRSDSGFYQVTAYDVNYAPSLVISRERQPWCTEKFEYNRAACIYQMYLQGAKKWVLPDSWAYTLEQTDKHAPKEPKNDAEKLKNAIQNRLYTKFHSEACMHYGRAFLSNDMWDSERVQHLRYSCAKVLRSYGIGLSAEEDAAAAEIQQQQKQKQKKQKQKQKKRKA